MTAAQFQLGRVAATVVWMLVILGSAWSFYLRPYQTQLPHYYGTSWLIHNAACDPTVGFALGGMFVPMLWWFFRWIDRDSAWAPLNFAALAYAIFALGHSIWMLV